MKFKSSGRLVAVVMAILIFSIPIFINKCYKHGSYVTIWRVVHVFSYYVVILVTSIAIGYCHWKPCNHPSFYFKAN